MLLVCSNNPTPPPSQQQQQLNQGRYWIHVGTFSSFRDREIAVNKNKFVKYIAHGRDV